MYHPLLCRREGRCRKPQDKEMKKKETPQSWWKNSKVYFFYEDYARGGSKLTTACELIGEESLHTHPYPCLLCFTAAGTSQRCCFTLTSLAQSHRASLELLQSPPVAGSQRCPLLPLAGAGGCPARGTAPGLHLLPKARGLAGKGGLPKGLSQGSSLRFPSSKQKRSS